MMPMTTSNEPELDLFVCKQSKRRVPSNVQPLRVESDVRFSFDASRDSRAKSKGKGKGKNMSKSQSAKPDFTTLFASTFASESKVFPSVGPSVEPDASCVRIPADDSDVEDAEMISQGLKRKDATSVSSPQKADPDKKRMKIPPKLTRIANVGQGNCLFHCLAQAESTSQKQRSHRQVRAYIVAYMTKHAKKYQEYWDGLGPNDVAMNGSFEDYLQAVGKDKAWAGYLEIGAYSEAVGRPVLIVHAKDNLVHCFNSHAPAKVVCLLYEAQHYELIVPSDSDLQALWQNAEDGGTKGHRGAAKKARRDSDAASLRSAHLSDFASSELSDFALPGRRSSGSSARLKDGSGGAHPSAAAKPEDSVSLCLSQFATPKSSRPSPRINSLGKSIPTKRSAGLTDFASTAKLSPRSSSPAAASASAQGARQITWTCHICEWSFSGDVKKVCARRKDHIRRAHKGTPASNFSHAVYRRPLPITPVTHEPTPAAVSWTCGFCMGTLPILPKTQQKASVVAHLRQCNKAPKGATRGDSLSRLCKRARISPVHSHRSILVKLLKIRQMYQQLNRFAKEQGHSFCPRCSGSLLARKSWPSGKQNHSLFTCPSMPAPDVLDIGKLKRTSEPPVFVVVDLLEQTTCPCPAVKSVGGKPPKNVVKRCAKLGVLARVNARNLMKLGPAPRQRRAASGRQKLGNVT